MQTCRTIDEIRQAVRIARGAGRSIAVVPTMGALHAGHASLIDAAVKDGRFVVVTIFVNPTQFGPNEDFSRYPRTLEADLLLCAERGAQAAFVPQAAHMYPPQAATTIHVKGLTDGLCGRSRPGHFEGVCTVVAKLFNIVQPDAAYFGQKDAQQVAVIRRMAADLDFPLEVIVCPTVREPDGLAMSSRNAYLTPAQREQAPALHTALRLAEARLADGERDAESIVAAMKAHLAVAADLGQIDYVEIVDPDTLKPVDTITGPALIALAVKFPSARLIDNLLVDGADPKA